jgi:dihydropteroate synthase
MPAGVDPAGPRTLVMAVLNLTPDSFSDGGQFHSTQAVVDRAGALLAEGADLLDVGGESTRPGHAPVGETGELARVLPVIEALRKAFPAAPISIDTYKAAVAQAAIRAGADIINDILGGMSGVDAAVWRAWREAARNHAAAPSAERGAPLPETAVSAPPVSPMARVMAGARCPVILMHNRAPGRDYADFWPDMLLDLRASVAMARAAGVAENQIWLDPGFGFAKDAAQNLEALKHLGRVVALGPPVLLATSRKSTIGRVLDEPVPARRDAGTAATLVWGVQQGARMVRVHDVAGTRPHLLMADAIRAGLSWRKASPSV